MNYIEDEEIDLSDRTTGNYIISSQHRQTRNPNKSIWIITYHDEVDCFIQAINGNWKIGNVAWGVSFKDNNLQVVGRNNLRQELKLAKFVDGNNKNVWHGYPADYMRKAHDRPATNVLKEWVNIGFLTKAKMNKIRLGQSCSL